MNRELIGILAKFKITYKMLSDELNISLLTLRRKIKEGTFTQNEMIKVAMYLKYYDKSLSIQDIFFK